MSLFGIITEIHAILCVSEYFFVHITHIFFLFYVCWSCGRRFFTNLYGPAFRL